jgi:hypothetical protein
MGTELYINGFLVDLDQNPVFPLTFSVIELTDLSKRSGAKSKTITLPGTSRNCALLNSIFVLDNAQAISANQSNYIDFDPTIKATAFVYQNGLLQFNGICQLLSCIYSNNSWSFEVALISDMRDYIAEMSKIKLNELDFTEYTHDLTLDNVRATWDQKNIINGVSTTVGSGGGNWLDNAGYYYGLIEYGYDRVDQVTWALNQIPLQIFCYQILKKLFAKVGLTWDSHFLETNLFRRCALAYQGGDIPNISPAQADYESAYNSEISNPSGFIIVGNRLGNVNIYDNMGSPEYVYNFGVANFSDNIDGDVIQDNLGQIVAGSPLKFKCLSNGLYSLNYYGRHVIDLTIDVGTANLTQITGSYKLNLEIYKNGAIYSNETIYQGPITSTSLTQSFTVDFSYNRPVNALINDEFTTVVKLTMSFTGFDLDTFFFGEQYSYNVTVSTIDTRIDYAKQIQELVPGAAVYVSTLLPDMTGSDFFNGLCKMFNLLVSPSKTDPTILNIEPLIEYYKSPNEALQWTAKIDESKDIEVMPSINFASKSYSFRFADSDDYYNQLYFDNFGEQYGSFLLDAQNEYGKDSTVYQLPFAQKVLANIPINDTTFTNLITPQCWVIGSDGNVSPKQGKPFIVQVGKLQAVSMSDNFKMINESGVTINLIFYPYVGHLDDLDNPDFDLNFGVPKVLYWAGAQFAQNNLYPYHEQFIKEIISRFGKLLKCYINLNSTDIFTLDFRSLINLGGVVYRLQKISDYNTSNDESTKVELLKYIS